MPRGAALSTAIRWPVGILLTGWHYMWRTTPLQRRELPPAATDPPPLPESTEERDLLRLEDGVGRPLHRLYRAIVVAADLEAEALMGRLREDLDRLAPSTLARFEKVRGAPGQVVVGDEYLVRMPGPWNGPVRVVDVTPLSIRLATLRGHLEAGQIEFRARGGEDLEFSIESWACSGDRLSDLLYSHLGMAKEVQLHMWTSALEQVAKLAGGSLTAGVHVTTQPMEPSPDRTSRPRTARERRELAALRDRPYNLDLARRAEHTRANGWHVDELRRELPGEPSGEPVPGGSWEVAQRLMRAYQVADPDKVRARFDPDTPLEGRDMLLEVRFLVLRFYAGVRVGRVYDEHREVDGRPVRVFGWEYSTLEGHFEMGQMDYEVWKWLDTGDVEFRIHAYSRAAGSGSLVLRLGFRLVGRRQQLGFYRAACRRIATLTSAQLELQRARARVPEGVA
jgi:uncharacterized protein (UPF0548 family)